MIYPEADKLEEWGNKYALVALAAKRAKQLKNGAPPLIETDSRNPLTIALEEIAAGKITCKVPDTDFLPTTTLEPEVAELLAIPKEMRQEEEGEEEAEVVAEIADESELDEEGIHVDEKLADWEEEPEEEEILGIVADSDEEEVLPIVDIDEPALGDEPDDKPTIPGRQKETAPDLALDVDADDIPDIDVGEDIDLEEIDLPDESEDEHEEEWEEQ